MSKVRTTVIVEESLLDEVKKLAFERKQTFTQFLEQSLRSSVKKDERRPFTDLPVVAGGKQLIDLEDKELLAEIEGSHAGL